MDVEGKKVENEKICRLYQGDRHTLQGNDTPSNLGVVCCLYIATFRCL